ncbi:CHAT domain-containing protein [Microcoleus sp. herbarium8]|uniref:CHAT domain-containing protein n=1 Tax=Microcoleus sp. herbarium8 TaxID=3055436 RepID=UPI002FD17521
MDENRAQAYLNLIGQLLTCRSGQETQILQERLDLVDVFFLDAITEVSRELKYQDNQDYLTRLQNVIAPLVIYLLQPNLKAYIDFLQVALPEAWINSQIIPESIHEFLLNHLDLLDERLAILLRHSAINIRNFDPQTQRYFAYFNSSFSRWMIDFTLGNRANNLEIAMAGYEVAIAALNREIFPHYWAEAVYNLGNVYRQSLRGKKAENLESAIKCYKLALDTYTPETPQKDWGEALNNLGLTYNLRIYGEKTQNLEDAIYYLLASLDIRTRANLANGVVQSQRNLGYIYRNRIKGDKADNLESSIRHYEAALDVKSPEISTQERANIQHSLGYVYHDRMKGSKAENLERAIDYYKKALEGRSFESSPENWAETHHNLGNIYCDRIWGEKSENLELAIDHLLKALKVRTFEACPEKWANTQNTLGNAYRYLTESNKKDNFKATISCYEEALKVYTAENSPKEWSRIKYNIGALYSDYLNKIASLTAEKIVILFACSSDVSAYLIIYPEIWEAIRNLEASLEVRTHDKYPIERAESLNVIASVYILANLLWEKVKEIRKNKNGIPFEKMSPEMQILAKELGVRELLGVRGLQELLGDETVAEIARILEISLPLETETEIIQNIRIETAIGYLIESFSLINFQDNPQIWGENQITLAYAYLCLKDLPENQELVIASYKEALKGFTQKSFPHDHLEVQYEVGKLCQKNHQLSDAYSAFAAAIDTVELLRNEINYVRDESKDKLAEKWKGLYQDMVKLCLDLKKYSEAIEYVERSKSRNLVELLANSELEPKGASDSLKQELRNLRNNISSIQLLLANTDNNTTFNRDSFHGFRSSETSSLTREYIAQQRELLQEYQRQLDEVFAQCQKLDPAFTLTQKVNHITVAEIRDLIDSHTAILEWYIGTDSFQLFIVTQSSLEVVQFDKAELDKLEAWNQQYLEALFNNTKTWRKNLSEWLNSLSQILRVNEILNHPALDNCESLILVPHRYLHLFPLHALSVSQQTWLRFNQETPHLQPPANPCLLDCFKKGVRYAPSCQLLQRVQQRQRPPADTRALFAIQNPTEDLRYTDIEVEVIKQAFTPADILIKQQATKTALIDNLETLAQAHYVHFSCHGSFDFQTPLMSSLILAGAIESTDSLTPTGQKSLRLRSGGQANPAKCLTLQDIFATLNLPKCRLVTLSACETGLTDTTKQSDDCIGLATGFLYAGSQGVLSSLWSVNDLATAFLMIKFYENLATADMAVALNTAQIWLRDATKEDLQTWTKQLPLNPTQKFIQLPALFNKMEANTKPFQSPDYWAAFCAVGK